MQYSMLNMHMMHHAMHNMCYARPSNMSKILKNCTISTVRMEATESCLKGYQELKQVSEI